MNTLDPEWVSPDVVWIHIEGTVDLGDVEFIDSAGLRVIADAEARARRAGRSLKVAADPNGIVRRLLRLTTIDMRIPVVDSPSPIGRRGAVHAGH